MQYELSSDERSYLNAGTDLVDRFDREYWRAAIENRRFPHELWRALGETGHLGLLVGKDMGGSGKGLSELALVTEGMAAAGFPMLALITAPGLALPAIGAHGAPALRERVLADLLSGMSLIAFAITEREAGSSIFEITTSADVDGDHIVLNGAKVFTSTADVASYVLVVARTQLPGRKYPGFSVVMVPRDAAGFTRNPSPMRLAAAESQCDLFFDNVTVPLDHVLGAPGDGLRVLAPALTVERVLAGALACGIGQFALDVGGKRARERVLYGKPIGSLQGVQHPLAAAATVLSGARHLVRHAATAADHNDPAALGLASMASYGCGAAGYEATDAALQCMGGYGYTSEGELHTMLGLARLLRSAPINAQTALSSVGELVLGLPRSY